MFYLYLAIVIACSFGIGFFVSKQNQPTPPPPVLVKKPNLEKQFMEKGDYFTGTVEMPDGAELNVMFTEKELEKGIKRALKNPEDFA